MPRHYKKRKAMQKDDDGRRSLLQAAHKNAQLTQSPADGITGTDEANREIGR